VQSVKLHCIYLRLCHIAIAISMAHSFWQFSLIFFCDKNMSSSQKSYKMLVNFQHLQNSAKLCENIKILWQKKNSTTRGKLWDPNDHLPQGWLDKNKYLEKFCFTLEATFSHHQNVKDLCANMLAQICQSAMKNNQQRFNELLWDLH